MFSLSNLGENVITQCSNQGKQLSRTSGPIIVVTPGYPNLYNSSEQCNNVINLDSELSNGRISIVDRESQGINSYSCGTGQQIKIRIIPGILPSCSRLNSAETFQGATTFTFQFSADLRAIRGILYEVTAGKNTT